MNAPLIEQKAGQLTVLGIFAGIPKFVKRINDALKTKNITIAKMIRIYSVVETAVKEIEAMVKEK